MPAQGHLDVAVYDGRRLVVQRVQGQRRVPNDLPAAVMSDHMPSFVDTP